MDFNVKNEQGENINASFLRFFSVPDLEKEFAMYSINDDNPDSKLGAVLLGEVVRDGDNIQILGIEEDEKDLVVAYYNEISNQVGGNGNE